MLSKSLPKTLQAAIAEAVEKETTIIVFSSDGMFDYCCEKMWNGSLHQYGIREYFITSNGEARK